MLLSCGFGNLSYLFPAVLDVRSISLAIIYIGQFLRERWQQYLLGALDHDVCLFDSALAVSRALVG